MHLRHDLHAITTQMRVLLPVHHSCQSMALLSSNLYPCAPYALHKPVSLQLSALRPMQSSPPALAAPPRAPSAFLDATVYGGPFDAEREYNLLLLPPSHRDQRDRRGYNDTIPRRLGHVLGLDAADSLASF